jgi:hypothetical protein
VKKLQVEPDSVFLNIPYDKKFTKTYLAYLSGLVSLGLNPKATLAIPGGVTRLDRIFALIRSCRYSLHDLSRVELDRTHPPTPRFNMPLELGITVAWAKLNPMEHTWFVFESQERRAQKSISDLNGTDCNIHGGTEEGVMRELCNAFVRRKRRVTVPEMLEIHRELKKQVPGLMRRSGAASVFEPRIFDDLLLAVGELRDAVLFA